jgi:predicted phosphodiesterase
MLSIKDDRKFGGKTYVMSDIHGQFKAMVKVLTDAKVDFVRDRLYILGDYVDWGPRSLEVLRYMVMYSKVYENVKCVLGNHDFMFYKTVLGEGDSRSSVNDRLTVQEIWEFNGEEGTLNQLSMAYPGEDIDIAMWLENLPIQYEVTVKGKTYVLAHSCPIMYEEVIKEQSVWERVTNWYKPHWELFKERYGEAVLVSGHTITKAVHAVDTGKCVVYFDEKHPYVNIDCGAKVIGIESYGRLALLRLDDNRIWYSDRFDDDVGKL